MNRCIKLTFKAHFEWQPIMLIVQHLLSSLCLLSIDSMSFLSPVVISEDTMKQRKLLLVVQHKKPAMSEVSGLLLDEQKVSFCPHRACPAAGKLTGPRHPLVTPEL